ncbi:MAG: hypothetical protein RRC07_17180 [Anaerolineae bacterium]|nr:hypothetical protein [Anaerolineae bacterium]
MRLDRQREEELARRKGLTTRTIVQGTWLLISIGATYLFIRYLLDNEYLSFDFLYNRLLLPGWVPEWALWALLILAGVIVLQFFFFLAYAIFSPEGRAKTGRPTVYSRNPDPFDDDYRR